MALAGQIAAIPVASSEGSFLVSPSVGLMIWTIVLFLITMWVLSKVAFPKIQEALDKRAKTIADSIEAAEKQRKESDELLEEYRGRLAEAREQADEIMARARKAAETAENEATAAGREKRDELVAQAQRDIEAETRRSLEAIRKEVADLTVLATEKVTRKTLTEDDQRRLTTAMTAIREVIEGSPRPAAFVLRPPGPGDLGWVVHRNGALYAQEYGWDSSYEALVARIVADYAGRGDPAREAAWMAELDGSPAGCVFCMRKTDTTAQLRLLLVEPRARDMGLGGRLVAECIAFARRAGYSEIVLWTNDVLDAARRIYQRAGFELTGSEEHHSFGHDLVGQDWRLPLGR